MIVNRDRAVFAIFGGLGNQMFQYAAGLYAERQWGIPVGFHFFDTASQNISSARPLLLKKFRITRNIETLGKIRRALYYGNRVNEIAPWLRVLFGITVIEESMPHLVDSRLSSPPKRFSLFRGYWQARSYLDPIEDTLRSEFRFGSHLSKEAESLLERINKESCSVAVHVRRGDYLGIQGGSQVLPMEYYIDGISSFRSRFRNVKFFVFSDDPDWVSKTEIFRERDVVISRGDQRFAHEDLMLMSSCKNFIVANSTFSWWGAWLNKNQSKEVIMPPFWSVGEAVPKDLALGVRSRSQRDHAPTSEAAHLLH